MAPFSLVFLLPASLLLSQVSSRAVNISTTWTLPQEGFPHFFRYFKDPTTWDDAKVICGSFHAELLTVENDERRDAARAYLKELDVLENVWCGLQRSTIEAPFVWTGGGQDSLADDAFWQEPHPLEPEKLCVSINPLHDFRWQSFPCSGPQQSSFVCQLEVPKWADNCLLNSLPSLTVTYLPEPGVIELLSDCGLSGTKRIACKGGETQDDLMARLSCDRDEEGSVVHSSTLSYTTRNHHGMSDSITTRSSNTRHKRESGATSTSTDTSVFATESEVKMERMPAPEPMSPVDAITIVAEYAKEDQIEETTVSVIDQTKDTTLPPIQSTGHHNAQDLRPPTIDTTSRLTVKHWLVEINDELSPSSTESPTTKIQSTVAPSSTNHAENTRTKIEIPPTTVTPEHTTEKESHMPHPPFIQFREKPLTKPPTTVKTTTTEEFIESGLVFTEDDLDTNATDNNISQKEDEPEKFHSKLIIKRTTEKPKTDPVPETSPTGFEEPTEIIPAQTSDAVPETARPATINVTNDVTQAEPKNTVTETATKIITEEPRSESTTGKKEPTTKPLEPLMSEETGEEAENPKRSPRGRLFPHSNPLSFYPYFLTKVLG